jgi:hypothetical protein
MMPLNSAGTSFQSNAVFPILQPTVKEPTVSLNGLTTAQCAANSSLTAVSVTSTITLVEAAKLRTNGITLVVPTDQPQVTFGNDNASSATPIQAITPQLAGGLTPTSTPSSNGFAVPPGQSIFVTPFNDAMYAVTPTGVTATIYFMDP